jgi:hypothetical protein
MSRRRRPPADDLDALVEPWLHLCGPCDAGLPAPCTCPPGDFRAVMLALHREVRRLRDEVAWLTGARPTSPPAAPAGGAR